ncbi:MAG TPA: hypothetical protein VM734_01425 [Kofleriaceae bacterium]|jgi:hypothetical protein|nr:hypothetical protein [Kofleriaceae bacterium]
MTRPHPPSLGASDTTPQPSRAWRGAGPSIAAGRDELVASFGSRDSLASTLVASRRRGEGGGAGGPGGPALRKDGLLTADELRQIEETYADGITAVQIVDVFASRGIRFSEASFRKYVQQGLLPRSRRVGRKGKNKGSLGVYPAKTVRRINDVKRWMGQGYTIEEIQAQFLQFTDLVENVEEAVADLCERLDEGVQSPRLDAQARRALAKDVAEARRLAAELVERLTGLAHRVAAPRTEELRKSGAAGTAEDLL